MSIYYKIKNRDKENVQIGKIICLVRNYLKHAEEMKAEKNEKPVIFLKPSSSVIFNEESIVIPKTSKCVHHEVELGVVIGQKGKKIPEEKSLDHILGYLLAVDVTARDIQSIAKKKGLPWTISKGFDTFTPISEVILKEKIPDPHDLNISLKVNGEERQKSNTKYMIKKTEEIIAFISKIMTLYPGDLILTGTPEGVNEIKEGDIIEAELENVCSLKIYVKKEK